MPEDQPAAEMKLISSGRATPTNIHGEGSLLFSLLQKAAKLSEGDPERGDTNTGISVGEKAPLIDKIVSRELRDFNATHAICLDAKASSSLGLGHREQVIHETLDPLTRFSWQDTLDALAQDYFETGECFLEVVFGGEGRQVTGLHPIESAQIRVELEEDDNANLFHYVVDGDETVWMAKWGDLEELKGRFGEGASPDSDSTLDGIDNTPANDSKQTGGGLTSAQGQIVNSEVIHIRQATNRSRWYGYPDYMSAVPSIELVQCMTQHEFDFYFNRGVPEFMLFLIGKNLGGCWDKIENLIKANQGIGNSQKTGAVNIPGSPDEIMVQVEKLAMEDAANSGFSEKSATLDMRIATAHGMPPALANIALPGKMAAANETPNAMLIFQMRKLGQAQKNFSRMFACTLGDPETGFAQPTGADKKLTADQFLAKSAEAMDENGMPQFVQPGNGFNTILDGMTLAGAQTMASMQDPMGAAGGRNPEDGKLDGARDRKPGDTRATRGPGTGR